MNDELSNALVGLVTKSLDTINSAENFLVTELPDYLQQLLLWHGVYNFLLFLFGIAMIIYALAAGRYTYKIVTKEGRNKDSEEVLSIIAGMSGFFTLLLSGIPMNFTWLQIWLTPKVFLVEYMTGLVK